MNRRGTLFVLCVLTVLTALVFTVFPGLDLWASSLFVDDQGQFALRSNRDLVGLREVGMLLPRFVLGVFFAGLLVPLVFPSVRPFTDARKIVAVLLTFLLGPGLVTNVLLKEYWDRPRPVQVTEFGGPWQFKRWYDPTGECLRNCSFVSGEGAAATAVIAAAAAMPSPIKAPAVIGASIFAIGVSGLRLAFGGHFLSDLIFAALFTLIISWGCFRIMLDERYPWGSPGAIERALRRLARRGGKPPS
ncbi:MAG: phosphatase PAP2 family protein [Pseudomonadota bacterium]